MTEYIELEKKNEEDRIKQSRHGVETTIPLFHVKF